MSRFVRTAVLSRLWTAQNAATAAAAGMSLDELEEVALGRRALSSWEIQRLAVHFDISTKREFADD
jgi:hypothetical protein